MAKLTRERLLAAAKVRAIFVHRFKWSHADRRQLARRMCADGLLVLIEKSREGFRYRATAAEDGRAVAIAWPQGERKSPDHKEIRRQLGFGLNEEFDKDGRECPR